MNKNLNLNIFLKKMIIKNLRKNKIAIVGLGYVGLPLLLEFAKKYEVLGFDINKKRINSLKKGVDTNNDADINSQIIKKQNINLSYDPDSLKNYNIYIITVPTPLKNNNYPDFNPIKISTNEVTSKFVDKLYKSIITAGTHRVKSIKIAEAAKVIENTQRDLNIALFNELSKIFHNLNLNTKEIIDAAATKWNFIPFKPGLVGGHCIGVDPYYLTYKSKKSGYNPKLILSGRNINNSMGEYICKVL